MTAHILELMRNIHLVEELIINGIDRSKTLDIYVII